LYDRFVARQPILDSRLQLHGYELLFRDSDPGNSVEALSATSHVIANSTMVFHWPDLVGTGPVFFNFSASELVNGAALLLPRKQAVIELPETIRCSDEIITACETLHDKGYAISLDGFADLPEQQPIVDLSAYLKVDFRATDPDVQSQIAKKYARGELQQPKLVAKKIETWAEYDRARRLGYRLFQGFFFLKPQVLQTRDFPNSHASALSLMSVVNTTPMDIPAVEAILKRDPGLTYKLLRYINSPIMERRAEVRSISAAVQLLGEATFRRWATLAAVISPAPQKPNELIQMALTRAFLCEKIAQSATQQNTYEFFLIGLLSLTPAILDQPLSHIIADLPLSEQLRGALSGDSNPLRHALDAVLAYEQAEWELFVTCMEQIALPQDVMPAHFAAASSTARELLMHSS
jgi:c-di-GMP-related signal transduction protein